MIRDESGFTLVELLVGIAISLLSLSVVAMMVMAATRSQDLVVKRVAANQRVRPVLARIVDELHSSCVAPGIAPIKGASDANGSNATRLTFLSEGGNSVTPLPDKHVIYLSGTDLKEDIYPGTGGAAPTWTFGTRAIRTLLTNVSAPSGGMFKYYRFLNGQLTLGSPLPIPLTDADAALVAYVSIGITAAPSGGASRLDANSPITLSDAADLRLQPASQVAGQENRPCT
jgi:pilin/secretion family protein with methylation motif